MSARVDLAELLARYDHTTRGRWRATRWMVDAQKARIIGEHGEHIADFLNVRERRGTDGEGPDNLDMTVELHNAFPAMAAELEELRASALLSKERINSSETDCALARAARDHEARLRESAEKYIAELEANARAEKATEEGK